jgi:hypothetical protein
MTFCLSSTHILTILTKRNAAMKMGEKIGTLTGAGGRFFFKKVEATLIRDTTSLVGVFGLSLL